MGALRKTVTLEVPEAWFMNPEDGDRHRLFYSALLSALAGMRVLIDPVWLPRGAERAARPTASGNLVISFHSYGEAGNILRCKESYVPPFYTMDRMGYSCFSELARFPERFRDQIGAGDDRAAASFVSRLGHELRQGNRSKYPQPPAEARHIAGGYVFVPLQLRNDSVAQGLWLDSRAALKTIVDAASARGLTTVIKRHPRCRSRRIDAVLQELRQRPEVVLSDRSIYDLIPDAELVVGANSGVLFEALLQDRPVISFAASDFGMAVQQVRSHVELAAAIARPDPPSLSWRHKFLFWYLCSYCVRADDSFQIGQRIRSFNPDPKPDGSTVTRVGSRLNWYMLAIMDRIRRRFF